VNTLSFKRCTEVQGGLLHMTDAIQLWRRHFSVNEQRWRVAFTDAVLTLNQCEVYSNHATFVILTFEETDIICNLATV
jgi:hypothetical protein